MINLVDMPGKKKRKSKSQKRTRNSSSKEINSLSSKSNLAKLGIDVAQVTNSDSENENELNTPLSIEANDSSNESQLDENEMLHQLMISEQWEEN